MKEDHEAKYMCKLCNKRFPSGRSLGGHMRSHVIYPTDQEKLHKIKRAPSVKLVGTNISIDSDAAAYDLRENPKKTCRFEDASEDSLLCHDDKLCKECGKAFQSWKALFGHMKCHSDKLTHTCVNEQDSWTSADQSDNGKANTKKKRSLGRTKRYYKMEISGTTSTSLSCNANASSSASENDQEQEEVALCLIMLSKDVTQWSGLKSVGESSVNNSEFVDAQSVKKAPFKELASNGGDTIKFKKGVKETLRDGPKMSRSEIKVGGLMLSHKLKKSKVVEESNFQVSEVEMQRTWINGSKCNDKADLGSKKISSSKRKVVDHEMATCSNRSKQTNKGGSHECQICLRVFSSGQALGGHKRSHLVADAKNNQNIPSNSIVTQKPVEAIRNFLDLNLPAPDEDSTSTTVLGFEPWWIGTNKNNGTLLGLLI